MTHNDDLKGRSIGTVPLVGDVLSLHPSPTLKFKNRKKFKIFALNSLACSLGMTFK